MNTRRFFFLVFRFCFVVYNLSGVLNLLPFMWSVATVVAVVVVVIDTFQLYRTPQYTRNTIKFIASYDGRPMQILFDVSTMKKMLEKNFSSPSQVHM